MASTQVQKIKLSGSTDFKAIKIGAVATLGTTIHTAQSGTTAGCADDIWLWATNSDSVPRLLTLEMGTATAPDGNIKIYIPAAGSGLLQILNGQSLLNSLVLTAFCETTNVVMVYGYVLRAIYS